MELTNQTSNLMLFCALILLRARKSTAAKTLRIVPLSSRTRRLADLLAAAQPLPHASASGTLHSEAKELVDPADAASPSNDSVPSKVHPLFGSRHICNSGSLTDIQTQDMQLRCPVCGNEAKFDLDTWQAEHLRIRGHLELYCRFCGTKSLWELADPAKTRPPALIS